MSAVLSRWRSRLAVRRKLLATARGALKAHQTLANLARVKLRKTQVAYAQRVVARHATPIPVNGISERGLKLIADFEGFRANPYQDAVGVWTVGYGETKGVGPHSPPMTQPQAYAHLRNRINADFLAPVLQTAKAAGVTLTRCEADALASLVYNVGPGILAADHSMGAALRSGDRKRIADTFLIYKYAGGRVLPGLVARRQAERQLFLNG